MSFADDVTPDEIQVFLAETEEQLAALDVAIVRLDREGEPPGLVHEIFRLVHTIKGSSALVGLTEMAQLAHAMESVLDRLRHGQLASSTALVDLLLRSLDALRALRAAATGEPVPAPDVADLVAALTRLASEAPAADAANGTDVVPATLVFDPACGLLGARALQALLAVQAWAEIVASDPTPSALEQGEAAPTLRLLLRARISLDDLAARLGRLGDVVEVRLGATGPAHAPGSLPAGVGAFAGDAVGGKSVRIAVERLDALMNLVGELVIDRTRLLQLTGQLSGLALDHGIVDDLASTVAHVDRVTSDLQAEVLKSRMLPLTNTFSRLPRLVRDLAQQESKQVELVLEGQDTELDRSVIEEVPELLMHLLRNAIDHGIELPAERRAAGKSPTGRILVSARHEEGHIVLEIEDDGRGIDTDRVRGAAVARGLLTAEAAEHLSPAQLADLVVLPGLSTATSVSEVSGRGVGMDAVRRQMERLNGALAVETAQGHGTRVILRLPLTLAIIRALLVAAGEQTYALPLVAVAEALRVPTADVQSIHGRPAIQLRGEVLPLVWLAEVLGGHAPPSSGRLFVVAIRHSAQRVGVVVDQLVGQQEIAIKPLGHLVGGVQGVVGATILGNGQLCPILDIARLAEAFTQERRESLSHV